MEGGSPHFCEFYLLLGALAGSHGEDERKFPSCLYGWGGGGWDEGVGVLLKNSRALCPYKVCPQETLAPEPG